MDADDKKQRVAGLVRQAGMLLSRGKTAEAEQIARMARGLAPDDPAVLVLHAGIRINAGDYAAAERELKRAEKLFPDQPLIAQQLGLVLHTVGRHRQALKRYDRAVKLAPNVAASHAGRGKVLQVLGRLDPARACFLRAMQLAPGQPDARAGLAVQLEMRGRPEQALELLQPLIGTSAETVEVRVARARALRQVGKQDEALTVLESALHRPSNAHERMHVHYNLGDLLDDLGRYDEAFKNYRKANELKPGAFDAQAMEAAIRRYIVTYTRDFVGAFPPPTLSGEDAVFIVGLPRSGTSLMEQILAAHPAVHAGGELEAVPGMQARVLELGGAAVVLPKVSAIELDEMQAAWRKASGAPEGSHRITDKLPSNFMHLGLIRAFMPGAKIIHCRRHLLDTALSCYFQNFSGRGLAWTNSRSDIVAYVERYQRIMRHWKRVLDNDMYEIDYEKLVNEPGKWIRRLIDFLGLEWDESCLSPEKSSRVVMTASQQQVREPVHSRAVHRYRHYEAHLGPLTSLMERKS